MTRERPPIAGHNTTTEPMPRTRTEHDNLMEALAYKNETPPRVGKIGP